MQLYLCKPFRTSVSNCVDVEFTGTKLRVFFKGSMIESTDAKPGECYYITPRGQVKYPTLDKASMPASRGQKIIWSLDFVQSKKHATSYADFEDRFQQVAKSYKPERIFYEATLGVYAFLLGEKKTKNGVKMQPLFAWVADDITKEGLDELIAAYKKYRRIHCGEDFLKVLHSDIE